MISRLTKRQSRQVKLLSGWSRSYTLAKYHWRSLRHNNFSPLSAIICNALSLGNWKKMDSGVRCFTELVNKRPQLSIQRVH